MRHIVTYRNPGDSDHRAAEVWFSNKRSLYVVTLCDQQGTFREDKAFGFDGDDENQTVAFDAAVFYARSETFK